MLKYILYGLAGYGVVRIAMDLSAKSGGGTMGAVATRGGTSCISVPRWFYSSGRDNRTGAWMMQSKIRKASRLRSVSSSGAAH